ncbi:MAG: S1 RNA-binding domain-containing protein [Candidatus Asgardarchaeia archaeon]
MKERPEKGDLVIATIKKIFPYGAFCTLDEYGGMEAFLHVSEIAPRWIKNIHEHIKEGQKIIAQVLRVDPSRNQIDISIKRVSESDKVWKRDQYRKNNRAKKLIERTCKRLRKRSKSFFINIWDALEEAYGNAYAGLEALSFNPKEALKKIKLDKKILEVLREIASESIKKPVYEMTAKLRIECFESNGVEIINKAIKKVISIDKRIKIGYIGAPTYEIKITVDNYKDGEKLFRKVEEILHKEMKGTKHKVRVEREE